MDSTTFSIPPLSKGKLWVYHFYMGVILTAFYIWASPHVVAAGYPGLVTLLLAEVMILAPLGMTHLLVEGRKLNARWSLRNVIAFRQKLTMKQYVLWSLAGFFAIMLVYVPLYPVGLFLRHSVFSWLPEWYFNPTAGTDDVQLIAGAFLIAILIDGIIGPVVEELFFRGYLLPRMSFLKHWAPILNGALFGLYHFWQPHNLLANVLVGIILSYVVWRTKNVFVGIIIHCSMNMMGALAGFLAVSQGVMIGR